MQPGCFVDPVGRYMHYETAYLAGELDPAFEVLTAFEFRHTTDTPVHDDELTWMRETTSNYRPENIVRGYATRYVENVHSDVAYGHKPGCDKVGICNHRKAQWPASSGECGPRAQFGRLSRQAFGVPTFGLTFPGHAAMSTWNPNGWQVLLGPAIRFGHWSKHDKDRSGPDFLLEANARELRYTYQQVLRGEWVAKARGEGPTFGSEGGSAKNGHTSGNVGPKVVVADNLWNALMLYHKKLTTTNTSAITLNTHGAKWQPARAIGPSSVPNKVTAAIANCNASSPPPTITTGANGTMTIPAAAFASAADGAKVKVMKSFDGDGTQITYDGGGSVAANTTIRYDVTVKTPGMYYLTANHTTWHINQNLFVSVNGGADLAVPVYLLSHQSSVPTSIVASQIYLLSPYHYYDSTGWLQLTGITHTFWSIYTAKACTKTCCME